MDRRESLLENGKHETVLKKSMQIRNTKEAEDRKRTYYIGASSKMNTFKHHIKTKNIGKTHISW